MKNFFEMIGFVFKVLLDFFVMKMVWKKIEVNMNFFFVLSFVFYQFSLNKFIFYFNVFEGKVFISEFKFYKG